MPVFNKRNSHLCLYGSSLTWRKAKQCGIYALGNEHFILSITGCHREAGLRKKRHSCEDVFALIQIRFEHYLFVYPFRMKV